MQEWTVLVAAGVLAVVAVGLAVAWVRLRRRTDAALARAQQETAELRALVEQLARTPGPAQGSSAGSSARSSAQEFVITSLGQDGASADPERADVPARTAPAPAVSATVFVDLVVRESAVRAGALAAGLRRALSPQARNRIRFEVRREVKRSRKERKAETRAALRAWRARGRAGLDAAVDEGSAA